MLMYAGWGTVFNPDMHFFIANFAMMVDCCVHNFGTN